MRLVLALPLGLVAAFHALAQDLNVCNQTILPVHVATISKPSEEAGWRTKGWIGLPPGECASISRGLGSLYIHGAADSGLSRYVNNKVLRWDGAAEQKRVLAAIPEVGAEFDWGYSREGNTVHFFELTGDIRLLDSSGVQSLDEAAVRGHQLRGTFDWRWDLREQRANPYRLGLTSHTPKDGIGLHIDKVYGGTVADQALRSGDRILTINGEEIHTTADLVRLVNIHGYTTAPRKRELRLSILRDGEVLLGALTALEYVPHADHLKSDSERLDAVAWFAFDSWALTYGVEGRCAADKAAAWAASAHFAWDECVERHKDRVELLRERYAENSLFGEVTGALAPGPGNVIVKALFGRPLRTSSMILRHAAQETAEYGFIRYRRGEEINLHDLAVITATSTAFSAALHGR